MDSLDHLLQPAEHEAPCGPELDYDPDFQALERMLLGTPERQYGETIIPAEGPDFGEVLGLCMRLLGRSRDLRVAITAARALTRTRGLAGCLQGLQLVHGLLDQFWESLHPALQIDGEHDPLPRANALAVLVAGEGLLGDLREARLRSRIAGPVSLIELERAIAGREGSSLSRAQAQQLLQDEQAQGNEDLDALGGIRECVAQLAADLRLRLGVEVAPDFSALQALLAAVQPGTAGNEAAEGKAEESSSVEQVVPGSGLGPLRTRQDAIAVLDQVCLFLERIEPANPAPLLIRRARNLIGQDFLSLLRELAPDGLGQAEHIAGVRQ